MVITVKKRGAWLLGHVGMTAIATALVSLVFNYGWRFIVDRNAGTPQFYGPTLVLGFAVYAIIRRDYLFIDRFDLTPEKFGVLTALGVVRIFDTSKYQVVLSLHKAVNVPEREANLSFSLINKETGRRSRNYAWIGFDRQDFIAASQLYGYRGDDDFAQRDL